MSRIFLIDFADQTQEIFDYLFDRLRTETEGRTSFEAKVKAIAGSRGAKPKVASK